METPTPEEYARRRALDEARDAAYGRWMCECEFCKGRFDEGRMLWHLRKCPDRLAFIEQTKEPKK